MQKKKSKNKNASGCAGGGDVVIGEVMEDQQSEEEI